MQGKKNACDSCHCKAAELSCLKKMQVIIHEDESHSCNRCVHTQRPKQCLISSLVPKIVNRAEEH